MMTEVPLDIRADVEALWNFHQLHHSLRPADVGIGLGSHDPTVPEVAAQLFSEGYFPLVAFTGANAPTTVDAFPRGEAVHFGEIAASCGVSSDRIVLETSARTTAENISFTRKMFDRQRIAVTAVILISRPYQQRRAHAICRKLWPEVSVQCASTKLGLDQYVERIGVERVVNMMVGDLQRLDLDTAAGFSDPQDVPDSIMASFLRLIEAGFTQRILPL